MGSAEISLPIIFDIPVENVWIKKRLYRSLLKAMPTWENSGVYVPSGTQEIVLR